MPGVKPPAGVALVWVLVIARPGVQVTVTVAAPTEALHVEFPHGGPHLALTALHRSRGGALDDLLVVR